MVIGNRVRAKVVKNKVAAPFREGEFDIMFDSGISAEGDLLDLAVADHIVSKTGAWLSYKNVRLGQGRENVKKFLNENPDVAARILVKVKDALGLARKASTEPEAVPAERGKGSKK